MLPPADMHAPASEDTQMQTDLKGRQNVHAQVQLHMQVWASGLLGRTRNEKLQQR